MMGIRSLLLAAFVISNVSWTTSRHHFRHHGNAHGSRNRRQDAGLYHPASYVIPGGVGGGPWAEWEEVSPCSRTCGGGVASQKRICRQVSPHDQPCTGGDTKYFSCQTQDCPENAGDFRAEQCSEFDHQPFRGIRFTWVPYTKAPNPCELNCMPRGERFYYKQREQVVDGTRCNDESFDVCVAGVCQPAGCDMMLGSIAREDKCRNCRGNGTNCHTIEGLLAEDDLTKGYNDMLLIPQGATNVFIEELRASNNYLALRGKENGEYYLNGNYEIVSPNSFMINGMLWHYERSSQGIAAPDKLRCMGPTSEPLYLALILQDYNVGIRYEYSVPSALSLPLNEQYNWVHKSFSECSASCGGGFQVREVTCRSREELTIVDDKLCGDELKPPTNQTCNIEDCPPRWVEGPWSPCSRLCGDGGTRSRQVYCEKTITNRETFRFPSIVADEECFDLFGQKPELNQKCNQNATCPTWFTGPWKPCNRLCGEGKQTRTVVCHQRIDGFVQLFEDRECDGEKPIIEKECLLHPCDGVDWVISEWSGCDTCLSTVRTRVAHCATKDHKVIDPNLCSYHPSPVLIEQCDRTKLPSCQVQWYATQWSNCSVECGTGVRTRRVFCGLFDGASVIKVNDERCDEEYKYNDTTECVVPKEKCAAKWFAGPWSECTKKCGGGEQNRRVMCLFSKDDLKCDNETVLHSTQSCNSGPCDKDDLLPLDSKSTPVLDDYDEEDCVEDDEEYPEVGAQAYAPSLTRFPDFIYDVDLNSTSTTEISEETGSGSAESTTEPDVTISSKSSAIKSTESVSTKVAVGAKSGVSKFPDFIYEVDLNSTSTTEISEETGSGSEWSVSDATSTTDVTESTETTATYSTDVESSPFLTSSTEISTIESSDSISTEIIESNTTYSTSYSKTEVTELSAENNETSIKNTSPSTSESLASSTTENGEFSSKENSVSSTTDSAIPSTTESASSGITKLTDSTTEIDEFSTTESGSSTLENGSSTPENINYSKILSTESSFTDSDMSSTEKTSSFSITEDGKSSITENEYSTTETTESDPSSTTQTTVSGTTENSESTTEIVYSITAGTDSSTIVSTLYSTQESTEFTTTTENIESSVTDKEAFSTTESNLSTTTENGESSTIENSISITTENHQISTSEIALSSITENDVSGTTERDTTSTTGNNSENTTENNQFRTTDASTSESSISRTTENGQFSTTENALSSTTDNGASITTETFGKSNSLDISTTEGSTGSTTTEGSTKYSTESSTSEETGTSVSTETTEIGESSTTPGSSDSTIPESSTIFSTESSTIGTDETGTSGSTETTEIAESSTTPDSTDSTTTESSTKYSTESSTSGSTETTEIGESSTSPGITDASTSSEEPLTNESTVTETTPWDWASTVEVLTNKPRCKPRKTAKCTKSKFGCCPDKKTPAAGPFDEGCPNPETCKESKSGCCPDGVSPAAGPLGRGCPVSPCNETLYGCCSDNVTAAEGNNQDGCPPLPPACKSSRYGCCDDNDTVAKGSEYQGCPETEIFRESTEKPTPVVDKGCATSEFGCCFDEETDASGPNGEGCPCSISEFGCCPDGLTTASGNKMEGCMMSCNTSAYGCCPDGETPAHGSNFEGCCLQHEFGCCPDNYRPASGPHREGCGCEYARYGCCADNVTIARGPDMEGCGCEHSRYGCCPDRHTEAQGSEFIGCECHTHQFGCCPDGVTIATGPELEGCRCERSKYGCCGDEITLAKGPNMEGCDCSNSKYGCCPDGETEAKGDKFLNCSNVPVNRQAACALNNTKGTCRNYTVLWFYDMEYGGCSQFWYGGCEGNANRFVSRAECEDVCVQPSPKDTCNLPKVKGSCDGYNVRWYYNSEREQCSQFVYGGCLGNANNFDSKEICQERCEPEKTEDQCNLALERGPCAGNFVRWGFSAERRSCEQFVWGGCGGNHNRYDSEASCQLKCTPPGQPRQECSLPQDPGNCTEKHPVWSFNKTENRCVPFYYTGCGGNDNRFDSQHSCDDSCPSAYVQEICTLPAMIGHCADYTRKWFFDTTKKRCRQFYYGGCGGNENNFLSESECENRCSEQPTTTTVTPELLQPQTESAVNWQKSEFCLLDIDKGPCTQSLPHWAHDVASGTCVQFQYGGCGGNRNNFPTLEYCQRYCGSTSPPQDVCQLPFVSGPCDQSITQWFYDTTSNSCSTFAYGGCEGNGNRFNSLEDCEQQCHVQTHPPLVTTTIASEIITLPSECQVSWELENCIENGEVWFLDVVQRACVAFRNEGPGPRCRHTGVFRSQEGCERTCGAFRGLDVCQYSMEPGPCHESVPKVYFETATKLCKPFTYSGCHGGPNRFSTIEECEEVCRPKADKNDSLDPCGQSPEPGNCYSYFPMWYYDSERDICNQFVYGGCGGSDNRFETQAECESRCKKEVTFVPITSSSPLTTTTTMAPSPPTDFIAEAECVTPVSLAPCGVNLTVYYFDTMTETCLVGDFGACRYSNSYRTEEECQRRCGAFRQLDVCGYRLDPGPCTYAIPKFYWDPLSGRCRSFAYGGCQGGPNRFSTEDECEEICGATRPEARCLVPVSSGTSGCGTPSRRWYYSTVSGKCVAFVYSGCGGNDNNFHTYEECVLCKKLPSPISETETGNEVLPDCDLYNAECAALQCEYGVQRTRSRTGCERCNCKDHPCATKKCSSGERCIATPYRDDNTLILYSSDCRLINKSGSCPSNAVPISSIERRCRHQCNDDADCPGVGKCCEQGCSQLCLEPAVETSPAPAVTSYVPEPQQVPSANSATKPEVRASLGGTATLLCLFHGNPPPKITWQRGQLTIEGDVGRYRLLSDGTLEIVSVYRNDSGVYICIADNGLGIARQEVNLLVDETETGNEVLPDCDLYNAECAALQCEYGVQRTRSRTGCERCNCKDHPCATKKCSSEERCIATPYRDPITGDIVYSSDCRLANKSGSCPSNTVSVSPVESRCTHECNDDADCLGVGKCCDRGCSKLCLEPAVATSPAPTVTTHVPETETGNEVLPDCDLYNAECAALQCEYGVQRTRLLTGCERCNCKDHPCATKKCSSGERCIATPYRDDNTLILYSSDCRLINKSGSCPSNAVPISSIERRCRHQCNDDADCPGVGKCCEQGCSQLCLEPAVETSPAPAVTSYVPEPQQEPSVNSATEPEVRASLGGKATLRCLFHGNPPPKITWKRRHLTIEGDVGRYRLLSNGTLEIVSVYRNDSGVYICIADNGLGIARQEVNLQVDDGVKGPAGIAGLSDAVVVGELGQPLSIRCMAYGYPQPSIYWYRGSNGPMVPYSSVQYEARDNVLQIKKLSIDTLGKYSCQTYNGIGKPVDWSITVKAYRNNEFKDSLFLVSRQNEVVTTPRKPLTEITTTFAPDIEIPVYTVPVTTRIISERTRLAAGSELSLLCEVDGYPIPEVYWTKNSAAISSDDRITVTETRLTVSRANTNDTGVYGCHAFNAFNSHYSSVQISVEGLYIPPTCKDNPFFANCNLIVRSKFCYHKYYSSFCCKSCVEAGQLDVRALQLADNALYRK